MNWRKCGRPDNITVFRLLPDMFHKATNLKFKEGTTLEVSFQDGKVKQYDIAALFQQYPQLTALKDRRLFASGKLSGAYGIRWNDNLDLDVETVYEDGITVREEPVDEICIEAGNAVLHARAESNLTQMQLANRTGIDQSDISKIERGIANPSIHTLSRLAQAMNCVLRIEFMKKEESV